ncbi:filamentous hemagglutinin N-terminal domain-containing protein [Terasakiella sp. A23]|uniref:two-partner secretion domain-containing protein n=1 Tax=Terasakiella sp. FCG-A23 TaxID=3080561 RepID=UPI0029558C99|nr:filamentous hemagglutinin N-terminal domain-containing protein [Terasakiella sp. A23]MDV7341750.1 filamentous hemagglutinin N-terminal domain-containing protein [Terasakiella sp. A23]
MIILIALQPNLAQAQDATITVDPATPNTTVSATINNTPLLQITAPNGSGVSHNKFTDFNVGSSGLVINNSTTNTTTNIGGAILANPNFSGTAATLILNEVTSANRSSLTGFTEIAGQKADYILANPNGITCNGCGFINTSRSTLTTGTPTFSGTSLESLSVDGGDVIVNSLGLNANDTDAFDIITRAAEISGAINAQELTIIAGRNDVKYSDRTVTKKADDGSVKPTLAIDSSALGGMYAGRIALIANETGVGVNMQGDMAASTSELTITADGRIDFKKASAKTDLTATSNDTVAVATQAYAENNLTINAPTITATGATVAAANNVTLSGTTLTATNATVAAGRNNDGSNATNGALSLTATGTLNFEGGTLSAVETATLNADQITDGTASNGITATGAVTITGTTSAALAGDIQSSGNVSLTGASLSAGNVTAGGTATINATNTATLSGHLQSTGTATLIGQTVNTNTMTAGGDITLTATTAATLSGKTKSNTNITLTAPTLSAAELEAVGNLSLAGSTSAATTGNITAGGDFSFTGGALTSAAGTGDITGTTTINGASYSGSNTLESAGNITVTTTGDTTLNTGASLTSNGSVNVNAQNITSDGTISSQTGTTLTATQSLTTQSNSKTQSTQNTTVTAGTTLTNGGIMTATNALSLSATDLVNSGTLSDGTADGFDMTITGDLTNSGLIYSSGTLTLKTPGTLTNDEGNILADGNIQIDADGAGGKNTKVWNYSGNIESLNGGITISTNELLNERKNLVSTETTISSTSNSSSNTHVDPGSSGITTTVTNVSSWQSVKDVSTTSTATQAKIIAANDSSLNATILTNKGGQIQTNGNLALAGTTLSNTGAATVRITESGSTTTTTTTSQDYEGGGSGPHTTTTNFSSTTSVITAPGDTFITAGGNITGSFTGSIDNISIKEGVDPVSITAGSANVHATSADIGTPTTETINAGITLPTGVGGLFVQTTDPTAKYVLETNPAVATLGALYGSDYFTNKAGVNLVKATETSLRLGDDAWETRTVREQIMSVTHKRFLTPSITSDTDQYKALMDNALAQHEGLKLSYGVELSADQVAALTSDIVWNVEVTLEDGRKALKPVVYFAEATRMAIDSSGAIIKAGGDLNLTAGGDITNSGTLSGDNTTLASTAGSITNDYGKIEATNGDLSVTADQNITNTGGQLSGDNVTLAATNGSFTNTTETWRQSETKIPRRGGWEEDAIIGFNDTTGAVAQVKASNGNLSITSGKDITDTGGQFSATGDASLNAGENLTLKAVSTAKRSLENPKSVRVTITDTTQTGTQITAGGKLDLTAGQTAILQGTKAEAGGDLNVTSGTDTLITAVQNTQIYREGDRGVRDVQSTRITNDLAGLKSGGNLKVTAGLDAVLNGVSAQSTGNTDINALASVTVASVQDSFKKDIKGSKYELHIEQTETKRSTLEAGGDLTLKATLGDVTVKAAALKSTGKTTLEATNGDVNLTSNKDVNIHMESGTVTGGMWTTVFDRGRIDETVQHTTIDAGDGLTIVVGTNGTINVDYKDFGDLDKSVERLSKEPGLEWMAQVKNGLTDVQWNAIKETHKSWDYSSQSISPAAAMVIVLIVTVVTMGTGTGAAIAGGASTAVGGGTTGAVVGAAASAAFTSLASTAAVSLVSNKGDIGAVLKDLGSKQALRGLATSMLTAGLLQGLSAEGALNINMNAKDMAGRIQAAALKVAVNTAVQSTVGGQELSDVLKTNLITAGVQVIGGELSEQIGQASSDGDINKFTKYLAHAAIGCAGGAALGGDCGSGAAGAVVGELAGEAYFSEERGTAFKQELLQSVRNEEITTQQAQQLALQWQQQGVNIANLAAGLAVGIAGGDVSVASTTSDIAVENNICGSGACATVVLGIMATLELIDKGLLAKDLFDFGKAVNEGDDEKAAELGADLAIAGGIEALGGNVIPGSVLAIKIVDKLKGMGKTDLANQLETIVGFSSDTVQTAYDGMREGHAIRHLETSGIIPNTGSLSSRVEAFKEIANPILTSPTKTVDWRIGTTNGRAFLGDVNGETIAIIVAKDGPRQGKVVASFIPDANQLEIMLKR